MATYLLKTEPETYSFADLVRDGRTVWTGVSNPAALIAIRAMKKGDSCFIYHTGSVKAVVGTAKVVSAVAYEDPQRPGKNDRGEPKFAVVDIDPVRALMRPVPLAEIRGDKRCKDFALVKQSRLSVMPVDAGVERAIMELAGRKP